MTDEYPEIPTPHARQLAEESRDSVATMLACLSAEEQSEVIRTVISLESGAMTNVKEVWMLAYQEAEKLGSHKLGHVLQSAIHTAKQVVVDKSGDADLFVFAPSVCDEDEHQLSHRFVTDFTNEVLNDNFEDSMDLWRSFLEECSEDWVAYINGVYGVCHAAIGVACVDPQINDDDVFGKVIQFGRGGQHE